MQRNSLGFPILTSGLLLVCALFKRCKVQSYPGALAVKIVTSPSAHLTAASRTHLRAKTTSAPSFTVWDLTTGRLWLSAELTAWGGVTQTAAASAGLGPSA